MTAYLIVNADDFGLTEGTNRAIIDAHVNGIVTSTSVLANGIAFDHAVALAKHTPTLRIGVHLTLTEGAPVGDSSWLPGGMFPLSNQPYVKQLITGKLPRRRIRDEFAAQIEKIRAAGIIPTHVDGHKYIHLLPGIADLVASLACDFDIAVMRIPRPADPFTWEKRQIGRFVLAGMGVNAGISAARYGRKSADRSLGFLHTGHVSRDILRALLAHPRPGVTEFVTHPAYWNADLERFLAAGYTWISGYQFEQETDAMLDRAAGYTLANFSLLA